VAGRQIIVTDPDQLVYASPIPTDAHLALFQDGMLLVIGQEYTLGPDAGEITLSSNPRVGDVLEFRRL